MINKSETVGNQEEQNQENPAEVLAKEPSFEEKKAIDDKRQRLIEGYALASIGGIDAIAELINEKGKSSRKQLEKSIEEDVMGTFAQMFPSTTGFNGKESLHTSGYKEERFVSPQDLIAPDVVETAYRAGLSSLSNSEEGLENAARQSIKDLDKAEILVGFLSASPGAGRYGGPWLDISQLDSKEKRMIQIGGEMMKKALPGAIKKQVEFLTPELNK